MLIGVWEEIGEAYNIVFLVPDFAPKTLVTFGYKGLNFIST